MKKLDLGSIYTPWLLQMRLALCFSLTETVLGLLSSSMMVGGTTTSRWPVIDIIGSVFTWEDWTAFDVTCFGSLRPGTCSIRDPLPVRP